jgi:Uma2 family endonuclease
VTGSARNYATQHPTSAEVVVEVSDTTLAYDMGDKARLYASASIADYWVIDVVNRQLSVFHNPTPDAAQPFGAAYASMTTLGPNDSVSPLAASHASIRVSDLLP